MNDKRVKIQNPFLTNSPQTRNSRGKFPQLDKEHKNPIASIILNFVRLNDFSPKIKQKGEQRISFHHCFSV